MKPTELRLGNYLFNGQSYVKVLEITKDDLIIETLPNSPTMFENCETRPIPLTEEWLLKFGFKILNNKTYLFQNFILNKKVNVYNLDLINSNIANIECVHQLQNLYFALTGEELKLKS